MRKVTKIFSLLLSLLLVLQLVCSAAGEAYADGAPSGAASVAWSVSAKDAEGHEQTFTDAGQLADALGSGFALNWGKDAQNAPITEPTVADLRRNGVKITPPAGYAVSSLFIVAEGASPAEGSRSLLKVAKATVDGSGAVTLPAAIFAKDYNASSVGTVFNGSGELYVLRIALERIAPVSEITLTYMAGALAEQLGDMPLFEGGNTVTLHVESGETSVSGRFAALDETVAQRAEEDFGKQFKGWKLVMPGGASLSVRAGDEFTLSASVKLKAQWKDYSNKKPITFAVTNVVGEYNGTPYVPSAFTISSGALAEGHTAVPTYSGQQTLPGESTGTAVFKITDAEGNDVTAQYDISVINCSITVTPRSEKQPLTVRIADTEKEYDGTADVSAAYSITEGSLLGSDRLSAGAMTGSITGVGSGSVNGSFSVFNGDTDVSENYEITVVPGVLTVKARAIVLTADSAEKDFDGKALVKNSFTVSSGTLVSGHNVSATVVGSQTQAGSSPNRIEPSSVKVTDGEKDVTAHYSIRLVDGTLTVHGPASPTAITITMKSAEKVYDGTALSSDAYEITSGKLAEGDTLKVVKITGEQTDAGESSVTGSFSVTRGTDEVTDLYAITVVAGKLTVKQREITLTAGSSSKIYDGRPLTNNSYKISKGSLVKGHKLKNVSVSGSQTEIGSSANVIDKKSIKITDGKGNEVTKNYKITTATGTLTVSRDPVTPITLSVGDCSKVYDGKPYRFLGADIKVTSGSLPSGCRIEATFNPEAPCDAGRYEITIKSVTIRDASGADVTSKYNISRLKGTLSISERPLTIETKAANKVYDGTALTERSTPNIIGRVENHQVTLRITGAQTRVGSSDNTVSDVKISDKDSGADVTKNYAISYQYGKLTVTEASSDGGNAGDAAYTWVSGSAGTLFIKFDHEYDGFEGLQVDGKDLDRSAYSSASGSTEIWLKASYLNTLSPGAYTLKAKYSGGESAQTGFTVKSAQSSGRTGDGNHLGLWLVIMVLALIAALAVAWYLFLGKDRRWKTRR